MRILDLVEQLRDQHAQHVKAGLRYSTCAACASDAYSEAVDRNPLIKLLRGEKPKALVFPCDDLGRPVDE